MPTGAIHGIGTHDLEWIVEPSAVDQANYVHVQVALPISIRLARSRLYSEIHVQCS